MAHRAVDGDGAALLVRHVLVGGRLVVKDGSLLTGDIEAFRLCNIAEKSVVVFLNHLRQVTTDPEVKKLAEEILADEEGHEDKVTAKLSKLAEDDTKREFLEKQFVQSWATQKEGVFLEAKELGIDIDRVLAKFRQEAGL